ncbi:hypothetical protein NCS57_00492800 [Fusarium keratoplasticum]|uniref:Uncharacterized protein n=1 Tax=Fusarium keratoplasticum TaxID=1328300 RepID=A0ACC0R9J0_9HYPO|nr:hypothetical protein NCS57_00492800 [Fusarium keratoplasticum]KAI8664526.1 hypothetical protein NCS55_00961700 [Fusarium keratoplasticum]KAI8675901.1 hypothetical protein NCS57_00492800 [Fusarium keratoplasticum]
MGYTGSSGFPYDNNMFPTPFLSTPYSDFDTSPGQSRQSQFSFNTLTLPDPSTDPLLAAMQPPTPRPAPEIDMASMYPMGTRYAHGRSFTNPDGRNNNCVATALARMEGYENADQFQEDMIGWRFGDPQFGQGRGMSPDDVDIFRTETGRQFKKETFTPTATQSAYDVMKASFNPIGPESLLDYTQPGGMGHAVNMYHDLDRGTSTIEDFQRSNFGERMEQHVQHATKIDIWSPLPETTAEELELARERRIRKDQLCREGKQSVSEWRAERGNALPGFEPLYHDVHRGRRW